ncbi:MAG: PAS sensor protein [Draconibacterium sp.]|nr:PAS sensor protein [Draconibacterium sp.]
MNLEGINVNWFEEFNAGITVCDTKGIIVYMNQYSVQQFEKYGGENLIGSSLFDCHSEQSGIKLREMMDEQSENIYTTEHKGVKRMIMQMPWKLKGEFCGLVEISLKLDSNMPNIIR